MNKVLILETKTKKQLKAADREWEQLAYHQQEEKKPIAFYLECLFFFAYYVW